MLKDHLLLYWIRYLLFAFIRPGRSLKVDRIANVVLITQDSCYRP